MADKPKKSPRQAYLLGLGLGLMAGAILSYVSLWFVFLVGVALMIAGFKFKELKKEAEDFFEVED